MNKVKEKLFRNPVVSFWITSKCKSGGEGASRKRDKLQLITE